MPVSFSLEVFPPKNAVASLSLWKAINIYEQLEPQFISVTCHGQGTDLGLTSELVDAMRVRSNGVPVVPHVVCYGQSRDKLKSLLDGYSQRGIRHIVALRGDKQDGVEPGDFSYASDLLDFIREHSYPFDIFVAGYPEKHPESVDQTSDIARLKHKVDAGASHIITQFFFDPDVFLRYRDAVRAEGIDVPVIPGILPILDFTRVVRFASKCQTTVPEFLHTMFQGSENDRQAQRLMAMNVLTHQITKLYLNGIEHFHFYTLNELTLTSQTCKWMKTAL